jgi:hypothetical protein
MGRLVPKGQRLERWLLSEFDSLNAHMILFYHTLRRNYHGKETRLHNASIITESRT